MASGGADGGAAGGPLLGARSVMLARDRRRLIETAARRRSDGTVVLVDRYPGRVAGATDGPQLRAADGALGRLADLERATYETIPPPDIVVALTVDVEEAIRRNRARAKDGGPEPDEWIRARHAAQVAPEFPGSLVVTLDTSGTREATAVQLRSALWNAFGARLAARHGDA
jgi:thymidylate kinase